MGDDCGGGGEAGGGIVILLALRDAIPSAAAPAPAPWLCDAIPMRWNEAIKETFRNIPGITFQKNPEFWGYRGAREAVDIAARTLEAAKVCKVHDLRSALGAAESQAIPHPALRPYQRTGAAWCVEMLRREKGALLADEMGLGKTPQAIVALDAIAATGMVRVLVVAPAIVVRHWSSQIRAWGNGSAEWIEVLSYEAFLARSKKKTLPAGITDLVLDEAHYVKNPRSQRSRAILEFRLANPSLRVLELTGTPLDKDPGELWHQLHILFPNRFGAPGRKPGSHSYAFQKRYCNGHDEAIPNTDKIVWVATGRSREPELAARLKHVVLRRTKSEVAEDLPRRTRVVHEIELAAKHRKGMHKTLDPRDSGTVSRLLSAVEPLKIPHAVELARDAVDSGSRILIGTLLKSTAAEIALQLTEFQAVCVTGDDAPEERMAKLQHARIGVATIDSLTTGVDLVQFDTMIFAGLPYVPSKILQFEARIHRISQSKAVTVFFLVALGTLDEIIRERVIERLDGFEAVLGGGGDESLLAQELGGGSEEDLISALCARI